MLKLKKFIIVALIISFSSVGATGAEAAKTNSFVVTLEETNSVPIHPPVGWIKFSLKKPLINWLKAFSYFFRIIVANLEKSSFFLIISTRTFTLFDVECSSRYFFSIIYQDL